MMNPHFFWLLLLLCMSSCFNISDGFNATAAKADVGVILDLNTTLGKICKTSISMAIEDFYSNHDYNTMIDPHFRDSMLDVVTAASAAVDLLKNSQVMAILGPQKSIQANFVIDIGDKVQVPIISPATSPSVTPKESQYFIRSAWCSSSQVKAIAAIVKKYGWREVVFVYEDTNYGSGMVPYLTMDLLESDALVSNQSVISSGANDDRIRLELSKLKNMRTRVFVVHMLTDLASRFFKLAKEAGMMEKGYAWIIADVLTSLLDSMDSETMNAMQGVLGVKAYIPESDQVIEFRRRWSKRFHQENPDMDIPKLNVFGLWAYDSITALAEAIEKFGVTSPRFKKAIDEGNSTDLEAIGSSTTGPLLVSFIKNFASKGLSGDFNISNGQLQPSAFEIVNVDQTRENAIGFWTEESGISKELNSDDRQAEKGNLYPIVWPGKTDEVPKGWEIPLSGKKLIVGVPDKKGFNEFVKVITNEETKEVEPTGISIRLFEMAYNQMPIDYIRFKVDDGDYDELVRQMYHEKWDAVVGDVTITAKRSEYADFTFPFTESGIAIVVPIRHNERNNAWIFMKPLTGGLWLTLGAFFVFTGIVVWAIEHRENDEFRGPPYKQVGMIFWFSFSTLVFAHREKVNSNLTRFVLIVWVFVVFVLTSSYTANLTSMLTVEQLQPNIKDVYDLIKNKEYVGYQTGSFVRGFLENNMDIKFNSSMLRNYSTLEEFDEALSKGSKNRGVGAVIDELPYIRLLLSKYCGKYTMIGPIFPTSGLGFAFPKGSPLVSEISHEILRLKESKDMVIILKEYLGDPKSCLNADGALSNSQSLDLDSFKGVFIIAGVSSSLALAIFFSTFLYENKDILASNASKKEKLRGLARNFRGQKDESSKKPASPDRGVGVGVAPSARASPAISIACDQGDMFSQDEGF